VKTFADGVWKFVDFVRAVDVDGFAGGVESDLAVIAALEMLLQFGTGIRGYFIVD
jgi:hypothetical protein